MKPLSIRAVSMATTILLVLLIIFNPNEKQFLIRVSSDYGTTHHGLEITPQSLLQIGESSYKTYILFSMYDYQFGEVTVGYFGVMGLIVFLGSESKTSSYSPPKQSV